MLSFYYQPAAAGAYESIRAIMRDVGSGWLIRGLHFWTAQLLVLLVLVQALLVFARGTYQHPFRGIWRLRILVVFVVFALAWTGAFLPWDAPAASAAAGTLARLEGAGAAGHGLALILRGGAEIGPPTLRNLYSIHILILPGLAVALILACSRLEARVAGPAAARGASPC